MTGIDAEPKALTLRTMMVGAILWAAVMALSALVGLGWRQWETSNQIAEVVSLFFICGLAAFPLAIAPAQWLARGWTPERRFALAFVTLTGATIGLSVLAYTIQYRRFFPSSHPSESLISSFIQFGFTTAAHAYQFAVMGMPLFFPIGFVALALAGLWFARLGD